MDLWIRSRDKRTLLKANRIDVDGKNIIVWDNDYHCSETYMGTYATEERALEVLDEIQKIIKWCQKRYEKCNCWRLGKINRKI